MRLVVRRSPGPPRLSDSQGITGNWVPGSAEVVVASPARLSRCKSACPALTVCQQQDSFKRWLIGAKGDRPLTD